MALSFSISLPHWERLGLLGSPLLWNYKHLFHCFFIAWRDDFFLFSRGKPYFSPHTYWVSLNIVSTPLFVLLFLLGALHLISFMGLRFKIITTYYPIPGTGEPCGLPSMGSHRVGHDWSDLAALSYKGLPGSSVINNLPAGDMGSIPRSGGSPGKGNVTHSSILAWKIPWTEEPDKLKSIGLQRVGHSN